MHKNKGTGQVWSFNGEVCKIESQKVTKCVQFIERMKSSPSHVQNAPQPRRQSTKLRNMIISMKTKVPVKFRASMVKCVELITRAKKLLNVYSFIEVCRIESQKPTECVQFIEREKLTLTNAPQPRCQSTKLRNMTISMKTKVLVKFGASVVKCVELRVKTHK